MGAGQIGGIATLGKYPALLDNYIMTLPNVFLCNKNLFFYCYYSGYGF